MILDYELMAGGVQGLSEHAAGAASFGALVLYIFLRELGIPYYRRRHNNPGNNSLAKRVLGCEAGIGEVKEACVRADERWKSQEKFNDRMEDHVKGIYRRIDTIAADVAKLG